MKIAIKPMPQGGAVSWFRGTGPGHYAMSEYKHSVQVLHTTALKAQGFRDPVQVQRDLVRSADVIHVVSPGGDYETGPAEFRERRGILSVDLDDDVWVWLEDPARELAEKAKMTVGKVKAKAVTKDTIRELESWLRAADVVTTTTPYLAEVIRARVKGAKVAVVPNAVPPEAVRMRPKLEDDPRVKARQDSRVLGRLGLRGATMIGKKKVVGWTGSVAHVPDLTPVLEALARVRSVDPDFCVRSLGPVDWMQSPGFAKHFKGTNEANDYKPVITIDREPMVPFELYYDTLEAMAPDVAVIPMRDSPFNASKSAVTLYSWGAQGVPCVVSETGPYAEAKREGFPARYVKHDDVDAWVKELRALLYDRAESEALGRAACEWTMRHHSFPKGAGPWLEAWVAAQSTATL